MFFLWVITLIWAVTATIFVFRNPLPIPDRGHRLFGVSDERAQDVVIDILSAAGLSPRFRFRTGPALQSLFWDNETVIHLVDATAAVQSGLNGTGISLPVSDPRRAATEAIHSLQGAGFTAEFVTGFDDYLPPDHLLIVKSSAFPSWVLVFRRHVVNMPRPKFQKIARPSAVTSKPANGGHPKTGQ
jgi:hypothetical protein